MTQTKIRKAVFPVAGLGTRFLPATKSVPKEMMNVVDRPVLQWVVDEAREAGIETLIFVTGRGKAVIEDHFDMSYELEDTLNRRSKTKELDSIMKDLPKAGTAIFTRQQAPLGLGHAVWCAREIVGDEPFAVMLPDMLSKGCMKQMVKAYNKHGGNVVALEQVPMDQTHQYGIADVGKAEGRVLPVKGMIEKPAKGTAPSNYIISGRYILQPEIFKLLEKGEKGAGGEIQLTDAMIKLLKKQKFFGMHYDGRTYDTGSKIGFLAANVAYGLERPELRDEFLAEIKRLVG